MALLTEEEVRRRSNNGTRGPVVISRDEVLSPSARDYLHRHRVEVVHPQGTLGAKYLTLFGAELSEKPEHMTHLKGNILVFKDHPRIVFRGFIDLLEAEITLAQCACVAEQCTWLTDALEEVLHFVRRCIRFDVLDESVGEITLCGYTADQLREYSHFPEKHLGHPHFMVHYTDGNAILALNKVRALVRQTELSAYRAFRDSEGTILRPDLILGLNRLSSLLWILMIRRKVERDGTKS